MAMLKRLAQVSESAGTSLRAKNRRTHTHWCTRTTDMSKHAKTNKTKQNKQTNKQTNKHKPVFRCIVVAIDHATKMMLTAN